MRPQFPVGRKTFSQEFAHFKWEMLGEANLSVHRRQARQRPTQAARLGILIAGPAAGITCHLSWTLWSEISLKLPFILSSKTT